MFKKITAVLAAVLLGVGISVVSVAAPASAHTPNYGVDCDSLWVNLTQYETRNNNATPNNVTVKIDDEVVLNEDFGSSFQDTVEFDGSTSHTWSIVVNAVGGNNDTTYDKTFSGVTTPCTYPERSLDTTCQAVNINWGAALVNGIHIHVKVGIGATTKQVHAELDLNIPGGYNGLGVRLTDWNGVQTAVPLTEQQVKSGKFTFTFPDSLPDGTTSYVVKWVQFNDLHFNQDENEANWLYCGDKEVTVEAKPSVTPPTCLEAGKLVIPTQTGVIFTGGSNGDGPGTYNLVAVAAPGYTLTQPYSVQLTVLPADPTKCVVDPKATVELGVCTATSDSKSQKPATFWFDNSDSEAPVTFTIPSLNITQLVAAGAGPVSVAGPLVDHNVGGSWDVYANGLLLKTLTVATFPDCLTLVIPGDPSSTDQECVAGELSDGSITIKPNVGKIVYVITGGNIPEPGITVPDDNAVTSLPAGDYVVTAHGVGGYTVGPENTWTYKITVGEPEDCEQVTIPVSSLNQMTCVAGDAIGSYTLPTGSDWVEWYVDGVKTTIPSDVTEPGTVKVEAKITAAGIAAGIAFTDGTTSKVYNHEFVAPEDCEQVAIPVSTKSEMVCELNAPTGKYTLPATEWVEWYVNGVKTTTPIDVHTTAPVEVEARITAAGIAAGIVFTDGTTSNSVTHTFSLPDGGCDLPTHALLRPTASQNNGSCTADPTYTLSNTTSESGGVQWWIGDPQVKTTPGTHKASWGSTVVVEATLVDPINDGFEPETQTEWTFKFPAKPACGDLITLALTGGSTGGFVPWIAGALLLLGAAGIYFKRRLVTTSK